MATTVRDSTDSPSLALLPFADPETIYNFLRDHRGLRTRPQGISRLVPA